MTITYDRMQAVLQPVLEPSVISSGAGILVQSMRTGKLNIVMHAR